MARRIVSIWLPRLATDLILRREPAWRDKPLALYVEAGQRLAVVAVNAAGEQEGIAPGMALADARALYAELGTLPHNPARTAAALKALTRLSDRFTPLAAMDGADGLFLDMAGATHLFGGEARFMGRLAAILARLGFAASIAMADTPGAASAFARYGRSGVIAPTGVPRDLLAVLPAAALRLRPETNHRLARLGLARIGDLFALPRQTLVRRFGVEIATRIDQALGAAPDPISPTRPETPYTVRLAFDEPIGERVSIDTALARLLEKLMARLAFEDLGASLLDFTVHRLDGSWQSLSVGTAEPTQDIARLTRLFAEKLDDIDPGFGIEAATLRAARTERLRPRQQDVLAGRAEPDALAALIDTLGNRLGFDAVTRFEPEDSWLPDRSFRRTPATIAASGADAWPAPPAPRPLTLLAQPLPVDAESDSADALSPPLTLKRHGTRRTVRFADGPERITPEWRERDADWPSHRDYWRVEDEAGERLWLYRQDDRWFLHGFFA